MSRPILAFAALLPFTLLFAIGCSSKPKLVTVTGTVTFDGKPAKGTGVAFWPADPNTPLTNHNNGLVLTDDTGNFSLGTVEDTGFDPGEYKVTFTRVVDAGGHPTLLAKPGEGGMKESVPEAYRDRDRTPVTVVLSHPSASLELTIPAR